MLARPYSCLTRYLCDKTDRYLYLYDKTDRYLCDKTELDTYVIERHSEYMVREIKNAGHANVEGAREAVVQRMLYEKVLILTMTHNMELAGY